MPSMTRPVSNAMILTLVVVCLMLLAGSARADLQTIRDADNAAWVAVGGLHYSYKEPIPPPNLSNSERD